MFLTPDFYFSILQMLMRGQTYKVYLDLEMPPSPTNEKLGKH